VKIGGMIQRKIKKKMIKMVAGKSVPERLKKFTTPAEMMLAHGNAWQTKKEYDLQIAKILNRQKTSKREASFWKKTRKRLFNRVYVKPNEATLFYREWLKTFPERVEKNAVNEQDLKNLRLFREYVASCYQNRLGLYFDRKEQVLGKKTNEELLK